MQEEYAIEVKNITKSFKVYLDKGNTMKEKILFKKRRRYEERKVLQGISFQVKKGEAIGLVGHNGCGKSTTLKLLTRIMYPDSGEIVMRGRVSSLIELGAGFHPDMSGRENVCRKLLTFRNWSSLSIILFVRILPECICVWLFQLRLMLMRIFY